MYAFICLLTDELILKLPQQVNTVLLLGLLSFGLLSKAISQEIESVDFGYNKLAEQDKSVSVSLL